VDGTSDVAGIGALKDYQIAVFHLAPEADVLRLELVDSWGGTVTVVFSGIYQCSLSRMPSAQGTFAVDIQARVLRGPNLEAQIANYGFRYSRDAHEAERIYHVRFEGSILLDVYSACVELMKSS